MQSRMTALGRKPTFPDTRALTLVRAFAAQQGSALAIGTARNPIAHHLQPRVCRVVFLNAAGWFRKAEKDDFESQFRTAAVARIQQAVITVPKIDP